MPTFLSKSVKKSLTFAKKPWFSGFTYSPSSAKCAIYSSVALRLSPLYFFSAISSMVCLMPSSALLYTLSRKVLKCSSPTRLRKPLCATTSWNTVSHTSAAFLLLGSTIVTLPVLTSYQPLALAWRPVKPSVLVTTSTSPSTCICRARSLAAWCLAVGEVSLPSINTSNLPERFTLSGAGSCI